MKSLLFLLSIPLWIFAVKDSKQDEEPLSTETIQVQPITPDAEVQKRLENIFNATGWFTHISVKVHEGVVFLSGHAKTEEAKKWATQLATNTQNVVAVINNIEVEESPLQQIDTVTLILKTHLLSFVKSLPSIVLGIVILLVAWGMARLGSLVTGKILARRLRKSLLQEVLTRTVGIVVFLLGVYLIFEMVNLTGAALTIITGTGVIGIILGLAFRDITENFLASILLSIHNPFQHGDLVEIAGNKGYVQGLTMRMTLLMAMDGTHIQIPNAIVYKSNIINFTSNPNRREDFLVGIGYENSISHAQEIALKVLERHEAVLKDPEPWVLVDNLGKATVNLRVYFWFDGHIHSGLKVKSSIIRLVKRAFHEEGISMPDEARERIFPKGISVQMVEPNRDKPSPSKEPDRSVEERESSLRSEAQEIKEQAKQARQLEKGTNLLGG
jgi:small conductance mechanosensitive channel